ncbi:conserved hypothetical protein [Leishmania major strain Friedlin]|uniref:Rab-GAP TBC domain-containing protein n=1 Tax=Leishmania major TaxID=5664 RepID=Q4Q0U0_LEIMA|nr:conserved hypothetical protein [Leishmania major strain Friedlin]CAG9584022.1 hypothetical_protein_-_conserved [Leishmania major strain Friedlin]CAJ09444.1 conserved hypothetical protein [Leishmania major strain Friedlin]|eukprot:XP_001687058.1 conserved hypothetical protein [Leishmania major strain Friedlin]
MAVHISSNTVVASLWGSEDVTAIPLQSSGQFLSLRLSPTTAIADNTVTSVAFHPVDETCFVLGTGAGKAYGVSLQENKLFLLADVGERGALRCATFCPGYLTSPIVVFAGTDNRLLFLDWQRGTVLQDVLATAHQRPILRIVTGASTESLFCIVSADAFSCWEPVASSEGAFAMDPSSSAVPVTSHQGSTSTAGTAGPSPKDRSTSGFSMPRYGCSGSALPTECTLELQRSCDVLPRPTNRATHRFLGVHILHPALFVSVEANGVLSLWSRAAAAGDNEAVAHRVPLRLQQSATTPSVLRVRCSAQCGALIVLGADAATVDELGDHVEPVVAFVVGQTLEGAGIVRLPSGGTGAQAKDRATAVTQVSAVQSDCVACLLSTGVVHVVLPSTFHLVFSIPPPSVGRLGHRLSPRSHWSFTPSGPTFGAMWCEHLLLLLHLPTARRGDAGAAHAMEMATLRVDSRSAPLGEAVAGKKRTPVKPKVSRLGGHADETVATAHGVAVVAQSFLRSCQAPLSTPPRRAVAADSAHSCVDASLAVLSRCRPPIVVPKKGFPEIWPDVNEVNLRAAEQQLTARRTSDAKGADKDTTANGPLAWSSTAAFCDTLSPSSCQYNVNQLQAHLLKHGVFPHQYRPAIWRFLAGLPSKAKTASQFAALARRPPHLAVLQLMNPFPLPPSSTRDAVENALSCLCWASPVFALASYLPVLVYPLSLVFHDDVQSVVELVLMFFLNWGRDFFVCHTHGPATLLMAMERQLRRLDESLCQHLDAMGAGVAVWGWELLTSFFTDSFTGAEWVQVMDHVITAPPLFLFAFHVTFVRTRLRSELTSALSVDEVRGLLRRAPTAAAASPALSPPKSLQRLIEEGYRLYHSWSCESGDSATDLSSFKVFQTLTPLFEYPVNFVHDSVVLAERLRELSLLQRSRDEEKRAAANLEVLRKASAAVSAEEAAYLLQQRARVAAKYDASAAAWQVYVAVERSRQEREAEERQLKWEALQKRTRNAEELEALRAEMNMVECQLRHDMVDRHMEQLKWRLAAHLTDEELVRLQKDADTQVERAVQRIEEDEQRHAENALHYQTAPPLSIEVLPGEEDKAAGGNAASPTRGMEDSHPSTQPSSTATMTEEGCDNTKQQSAKRGRGVSAKRQEREAATEGRAPAGGTGASSQPPGARVALKEQRLCCCSSSPSAASSSASSSVSLTAADETGGGASGSLYHSSLGTPPSSVTLSQAPAPVDGSGGRPDEGELPARVLEKASPSGGADPTSRRPRLVPPPRHAYCDVAGEHGETALNQRRFLELRDRVLSRAEAYTQPGVVDPLRRYPPPSRDDESATVTASCTHTGTATSSCPSSNTVPSSRRRLFDNYEPYQRRSGGGRRPYDRQQWRQPHPPVDSYTATVTRTSATSSTGQSMSGSTSTTSSYESPYTYTSYDYDYSTTVSTTWRTGETRSAGSTVFSSSLDRSTRPRSDRLAQDDGCKHPCASRR